MRVTRFVLFLTFLQVSCEKDFEFDPSIPLLIPCVVCGEKVSQRSDECEACDFPTSDSVAAYVFAQKRMEQKKREDERRFTLEQSKQEEEERQKEQRLRDEQRLQEQRLRDEQRLQERMLMDQRYANDLEQRRIKEERMRRDSETSVPRDFNARFIPGGKEQITFLEIFENYIQHRFAKSSVDFPKEEIARYQQEFLEKVKNGVTPLFVKVRNSKIQCSCSNGKVFKKKTGLQSLIVDCSICEGKGYSIGTINYRLFYSKYKLGGVQPWK